MYKLCLLLVPAIMATGLRAEPIKTLLLSGLNNHDWRATTPLLKKALEQSGSFDVDVTEKPQSLKPEGLAKYELIVSNWNSWKDKKVEQDWPPDLRAAYLGFVRGGKGHLAVHAGSSSFYD